MQTLQSFGIHFTIRTDKAKEGKAPIYACITVNGEKCFLALKQRIDLKNWDSRKGIGKGSREEVRIINNYIEQVRIGVNTAYQQLIVKGQPVTAEIVKNRYLGTDKQVYALSELFHYHNETALTTIKASTLKHYFVTQRYLQKFIYKQFRKHDLFMHDLNYRFINDFEAFLFNHQPVDHQKPMNTNGVMKHMVRFKKMINLARRLEWIEKDPFVSYRMKTQKVYRECLNDLELAAIEEKVFTVERTSVVRDIFVFCCYTGLAYIDVVNLTADNVVQGYDGELWLKTSRQKTDTPVNTPLLPKAIAVLEKYKHNPKAAARGTLFPVISNQKMNSYLKEIADLCGIQKNMTFHLARHTFATTVTLSNGVPLETVSKMLGHTKITTTQIYAKVVERKIGEDMALLKKKLG